LSELKAARRSTDAALHTLDAVDAIECMRRGEITAEAYADALLARCAAAQALNAFITLEPQRVLEAARERDRERRDGAPCGPLFGLPIPIKDSINTAEYPTTAGTPGLRRFRPAADAPIVAALRRAGALVLGKTNLHELSFGWTSNNLAFGAVRNPYDPARIAGGSSGGTAAAVAAGCAPLGLAEDTEGSIRVPAALCGITGFRPTTGRYSTEGCVPISPLFDQTGPQARSVRDLALFDAVLGGEAVLGGDARPSGDAGLAGIRLGVVREYYFAGLAPDVARTGEQALERLAAAGVILVESSLPELPTLIELSTSAVQNHDVGIALADYLDRHHTGLSLHELIAQASTDIQSTFRDTVLPGAPHGVSTTVYAAARDHHVPALQALFRDYFATANVAAIVFPATRIVAPRIGDDVNVLIGRESVPFEAAIARNIAPGSTAGLPGLVLPVGLTPGGLPVALEFDGPRGTDRALLALGARLESLFGRLPPPAAPEPRLQYSKP